MGHTTNGEDLLRLSLGMSRRQWKIHRTYHEENGFGFYKWMTQQPQVMIIREQTFLTARRGTVHKIKEK